MNDDKKTFILDGREVFSAKNGAIIDVLTHKIVAVPEQGLSTSFDSETGRLAVQRRWDKARQASIEGMNRASGKVGYDAWAHVVENIARALLDPDQPLRERVQAAKFLGQATGMLDKAEIKAADESGKGGISMSSDVALRLLSMLDEARSRPGRNGDDAQVIDVEAREI